MIIPLNPRPDMSGDTKWAVNYKQFADLLVALQSKPLNEASMTAVNNGVKAINESSLAGKDLGRFIAATQRSVLKTLEKEQKIVPKNYYRTLWMLLGMTTFGLPMGVAFGVAMGNIGLLGLGLPIGMAIGLAMGTGMDKKAATEGRQLAFEVKM